MSVVPPRLFGIPATDAPVVGVLRRGPTDWCQVLRWLPDERVVEPGAWFRGKLFPQRCDVSPDGRLLAYVAQKYPARADFEGGDTYVAVSRLPWLRALVVWRSSAWDYGDHFRAPRTGDGASREPPLPPGLARRWDVAGTRPTQFAVERARGWVESADTAPRDDGDAWDQRRPVRMEKARPGHVGQRLRVAGGFAAWRSGELANDGIQYEFIDRGEPRTLPRVAWADWHRDGQLLVATLEGTLELWSGAELVGREVHAELRHARPNPRPAPDWAAEP